MLTAESAATPSETSRLLASSNPQHHDSRIHNPTLLSSFLSPLRIRSFISVSSFPSAPRFRFSLASLIAHCILHARFSFSLFAIDLACFRLFTFHLCALAFATKSIRRPGRSAQSSLARMHRDCLHFPSPSSSLQLQLLHAPQPLRAQQACLMPTTLTRIANIHFQHAGIETKSTQRTVAQK